MTRDEHIALIIATAQRFARRMGVVFVPDPEKIKVFGAVSNGK